MPKATSGERGPNRRSSHGPTPWYGPSEASPAVEPTPPRSRVPRRGPSRPFVGSRHGGNSTSLETPLHRLGQRSNYPTGQAHLLPTTPRHGKGVRRRQMASATTPCSGRDRRPVSMLQALCRYSWCMVDLRNAVKTGLTPPRYCTAYPLYFLLCRTLGRHGRRPSDTVRPLTRHDHRHQHPRRPASAARRTAHLYCDCHTADWNHRARTHPGHGQKDSQGR